MLTLPPLHLYLNQGILSDSSNLLALLVYQKLRAYQNATNDTPNCRKNAGKKTLRHHKRSHYMG